jgi:hypothetical protein
MSRELQVGGVRREGEVVVVVVVVGDVEKREKGEDTYVILMYWNLNPGGQKQNKGWKKDQYEDIWICCIHVRQDSFKLF